MLAFLIICWVIDVPLLYYLYKEGFVVRSNMNRKYKKRFAALAALLIASIIAAGYSLQWAGLIAGIPAVLTLLFFGALFLAASRHKGPWN